MAGLTGKNETADTSNKNTPSLGDFDAYARSYDQTVNQAIGLPGLKVDLFTQAKSDYIDRLLADFFPDQKQLALLDVGCGVGNYHSGLKRDNRSITGIDVSAESIEMARSTGSGANYHVYDGLNIPLEPESIDFAFAICVYHHIPQAMRAKLTKDVLRTLKPGGVFAIFEHNPLNPLTMRVVNRCPFDADAVLLKRQESEALLNDAGFADVRSRFILTLPLKGKTGIKIDSLFAKLPLGSQYYSLGRKGLNKGLV